MASLDPYAILDQLGTVVDVDENTTVLAAFSGGKDSTVLVHLLWRLRQSLGFRLLALHVNHGILPESDHWEAHCAQFCANLNIEFRSTRLELARQRKRINENDARAARYAWLKDEIDEHQVLVTAHHLNDQAETVLLNLMRGAGVRGLAAIQPIQRFSSGWLIRPLLAAAPKDIDAYVRSWDLKHIEDPSNKDLDYERNYLRHEVLPKLAARWPAAIDQIGKSAAFLSDSRQLVDTLAASDAEECRAKGSGFLSIGFELNVIKLLELTPARRMNLIRYWLRTHLDSEPGRAALDQFMDTSLLPERKFAKLAWTNHCMYRYQDDLYLARHPASLPKLPDIPWDLNAPLEIEQAGIKLIPSASGEDGLRMKKITRGISVRFRRGGEKIILPGRRHSSVLKKLFQQHAIPPWERNTLPLIYCENELAAVVPWIVADRYEAESAAAGVTISVECL